MNTKVAIVGSGFGMYCLLPAFSKIENCDVISICGRNSSRMEKYCKKFGVNRYDDWKEMLETEKPTAVAIAVIPKHQSEIIKYSFEHKIAVFAEKPLTTSYDTSLELTKLAKQNKLPNMIDFEFIEIPEWKKVKQIIQNEQFGKISEVKVDWTFLSHDLKNKIKSWKTDTQQGGGAVALVLSHTFYYLEYFLGKIKNFQCKLSSSEKSLNNGETEINILAEFANSCIGEIHVDISNSQTISHVITFHSDNKKLILENHSSSLVDNFELSLCTSNGCKKIQINNSIVVDDPSEDSRAKIVAFVAQKFINWCNTGIPEKPDFEDGLRVQELIDMTKIHS